MHSSSSLFAQRWLVLLLMGSILPLAVALGSQFLGGLFPCELCLLQRYPYAALVGVLVIGFIYRRRPGLLRKLLLLSLLLWLLEAGFAFYHVGIEQSWWDSATGCTAQSAEGQSLDELRAAILSSPIVSCADPGAVVLGVSMAGWNGLYALALAMAGVQLLRRHPKGAL